MQAVLLAGVFAVLGQTALVPLFTMSKIALQSGSQLALLLILFVLALPLAWFWRTRADTSKASANERITELEFSPEHICFSGPSPAASLSVLKVSRQFGALTVKLKPQGDKPPFSVTIWRANLSESVFRKLSVLIAWHAQRSS